MAKWRSFGDRLLYCHRSTLNTWRNFSNPLTFRNSSTCGCGGDGIKKAATFPLIPGCSSCSSPPPPPPTTPRSLSSSPLLILPPGVVVVDHKNSEKNYSDKVVVNHKNFDECCPYDDDDYFSDDDYYHFFSLSEQNQFRVLKKLVLPRNRLPRKYHALCVGSSHGWLAFTGVHYGQTYLYNPLIETPDLPYIRLPSVETPPYFGFHLLLRKRSEHNSSLEEDCHFYLQKLVLSSAPSLPCYSSSSSSSCTIMVICNGSANIAFCKPGDDWWTDLDRSVQRPYTDIIYFSKDQRFYAMKSGCSIEAWDLRDPSCPRKQVFDSPSFCPGKLENKFIESYQFLKTNYLVESSGDLLLLSRFISLSDDIKDDQNQERENEAYWTLGFDVRKFDFDRNKWEPLECLGDRALFVGSNHSFSLSSSDYPELLGNSIYFTDHNLMNLNSTYHGHDNGVFCLGDNSIKSCYPSRLKIIDPHPVWVAPSTT